MRIISPVLLLAFGLVGQAVADDELVDRATLRGVKALTVVVGRFDADAVKDGLSVEQIRTDVELRLRKAGVEVAGDPKQSKAYVMVFANAKKGDNGAYAVNLSVSLFQQAVTVTNGVLNLVPTWSVESIGLVRSERINRSVREAIGDKVDQFINAYLSVNPK